MKKEIKKAQKANERNATIYYAGYPHRQERCYIGKNDLDSLREAIGNECHWVTYYSFKGKKYYCDEDGLLKNLQYNQQITNLFYENGYYEDPVGNIVVLDDESTIE